MKTDAAAIRAGLCMGVSRERARQNFIEILGLRREFFWSIEGRRLCLK